MADNTQEKDLKLTENEDGTLTVYDPEEHGAGGTTGGEQRSEGDGEQRAEESANEAHGAAQHGEDEEDDDDATGEPGEGEQDERLSKTEQNRQKRQERKRKIQERTERYQRELAARDATINELATRLATLEKRSSGSELAMLDGELRKTADAYAYYKGQIEAAHGLPEAGKIIADATEKMLKAQQRATELARVRQAFVQRQTQPAALDPRLLSHGQAWLTRNTWFAEGGEDAEIARAIDSVVAQEGYNPATEAYWTELERRLRKKLPHRYESEYNRARKQDQRQPRSVVTGSAREGAAPSSSGGGSGYTLSKERVAALKEAGMWDNVEVRNKMIRRYREQDRAAAAGHQE